MNTIRCPETLKCWEGTRISSYSCLKNGYFFGTMGPHRAQDNVLQRGQRDGWIESLCKNRILFLHMQSNAVQTRTSFALRFVFASEVALRTSSLRFPTVKNNSPQSYRLLITYEIHLTRVQGALFSPVASCDTPSPLTRINITTDGLILGVMEHAEPSGALMLYDWETGAKRTFQSVRPPL